MPFLFELVQHRVKTGPEFCGFRCVDVSVFPKCEITILSIFRRREEVARGWMDEGNIAGTSRRNSTNFVKEKRPQNAF